MPACSMGFCAARSMNSLLADRVRRAVDGDATLLHDLEHDCVFGEARLISSASTIAAKIGPGWNSNACLVGS